MCIYFVWNIAKRNSENKIDFIVSVWCTWFNRKRKVEKLRENNKQKRLCQAKNKVAREKKRISKWLENRIAIERTVAIGQIATFGLVLSFLSCPFVVWNVHFINNNKHCVCASHIEMKRKTTKIN